ncbi:MAG TPA: helix-turn-helix domain-containing protein [Candidatus Methylomirabilis sp.]|nr:helix-turn-helix domain-containing protein [Candidatus Methylomirabilis sp.]
MKTLTLQEAAARLRLSPKTLYNRLSRKQAKELRAVKVYGRWRIPADAVEDILASGTVLYEFGGEIPRTVRFADAPELGPLAMAVYRKLVTSPKVRRLIVRGMRDRMMRVAKKRGLI